MLQQLPLALQLRENAILDNFIATGNETLLHSLCDDAEKYIYLWGEEATGKSHLLQGLCHRATQQGQTVVYMPIGHEEITDAGILTGLETFNVVCLDNIEFIAGKADWEAALFHLFNRVRDAGGRLIIAGSVAPGKLDIKLADLESRLNWGAVFQLVGLNDDDKLRFLQDRAEQRGLELSSEVAAFLLKRYPRDMGSLFDLIDKLDQASLAAQRKLTIPFVREFL